ncbi:hypothetical protein [Vibrio cyclitrophicus]|uniref:hypothetical protein n=1 Tax=Vibrio cyclitrophicus TaxID=47951 RepID=UPI0007EEA05E|nr:hypothetical protein [Vibrio cyclitrophicus]OBT07576.1 hypothetical protein A9265_14290 [Vibrio cyclitrophicus]
MKIVSWKFVLVIIVNIISFGIKADPITAAFELSGKVVGAYTVNELAEKASNIINETLSEVESSGKGVVSSAAESTNIAISNLNLVAGHQGNQLISSLSKERQAVAFSLVQALVQFEDRLGEMTDFGDTFLLSFESTINDSVLGAFSEKYIVIQRFSGRSQLEGNQSYAFAITATNIGLGTSSVENNFELLINGSQKNYKSTAINRHKRVFYIKNDELADLFDEKSLVEVPISINFTQTHSRWYWFDNVLEHQLKTSLVLYPKQLSALTVTYDVPQVEWTDIEQIKTSSTDSCHNCDRGKAFNISLNVSGGDNGHASPMNSERLTSVQCRCVSGGRCWFDENGNAGSHTLNIVSNRSSATCRGHHRTQPTTWVLSATKQRYAATEAKRNSIGITGDFGEVIEVRVPHDAIAIRLKGKLITGSSFNVGIDPLSDSSGIVSVTGSDINQGIEKIIHITVNPPKTPTL